MTTAKKYSDITSKAYKLFILFSIAILFLGACKGREIETPELQSAVNVVNATIGINPLAFFIAKQKVEGETLKYTDESGYFITFPGARDFDAIAEGGSDYILKTNFEFKPNTYHTIFICGESSSISALFTEDDLTAPPAGKAKIRFVHLSPDAGGLVLSVKNGSTLFPEQSFKTASQFITLDPGVYDLQLKTGTGTLLTEQNVTVGAGKIYTVWSKGLRAGTSNSPIGLQFRSIN